MDVQVIEGTHRIVRASGEIDYSNVKAFQQALEDAVRATPQGIVIDLSGVVYIDSAGIQAFLIAYRHVYDAGGSLVIVTTHPNLKEMFAVISVDKLPRLMIRDCLEAAEEALTASVQYTV